MAAVLGVLGVSCTSAIAGVGNGRFIRGITWDGKVVDLDLATGAPTLRATGLRGGNNLTMDAGGNLVYVGNNSNALVTLRADGTGVAHTRVLGGIIDVRSLALGADGGLIALGRIDGSLAAQMWRIDPETLGVSAPIELTPFSAAIYGMQAAETAPDGTLKGWNGTTPSNAGLGLVTINTATGEIVDDYGSVGSNGALFQSMAYASDGRLFAVTMASLDGSPAPANALFEIDTATGEYEFIGQFGSEFDIRGIAVIPAPGGVTLFAGAFVLATRRRR